MPIPYPQPNRPLVDLKAADDDLVEQVRSTIDYLPVDCKSAYLEAIDTAEYVAQSESHPSVFLQRENNDVLASSSRLALYWQHRKELFQERAFLPLSQALHPDAVALLQTEFMIPLPGGNDRSLFFFDRARCCTSGRSWGRLRRQILQCLFALAHITSPAKPIVAIALVDLRGKDLDDRVNAQAALDLVENVLFVRLQVVHVCFLVEPARVEPTSRFVVPVMRQQFRHYSFQLHMHVGCQPSDLLLQLSVHGLTRACLPESVGGDFRYQADAVSILHQADPIMTGSKDPTQQQVLSILGGTSPSDLPIVETPSLREEALKNLDEAMDMLLNEEKAAYQTARHTVPRIVELESNPLRFLRYEKWNAWAAARRLAKYWSIRVELFGNRAYLPLTLTGKGALTPADVEAATKSCYLTFPPHDAAGRSVAVFEPHRHPDITPQCRQRLAFWHYQVLSENDVTMTDGFVCIMILGLPGKPMTIDRASTDAVEKMNVSHVGFCQLLHVVKLPTKGLGLQKLFFDMLLPAVQRFFGSLWRLVVHSGEKEELMESLGRYDLPPDCLPVSVGGTWTDESHMDWVRRRIQKDIELFGLPSQQHAPMILASIVPSVDLNNAAVVPRRVDDLDNAMERLPDTTKSAYERAMQRARDTVERECDKLAFLRREGMDATKAASRLAQYWEARTMIFKDRGFLPLDQSGEGALDRRDLAVLGTSYLMCLPNDSAGRAVLFVDGSRLQRSSRESRLRCTFYMFAVAAENKLAQTEGVILLYAVSEPSFDRAFRECLDLALSSLPICIHSVHFLRQDDSNKATSEILDAESLQNLKQLAKHEVVIHESNDSRSLAQRLEPYGMSENDLPKSTGGNYGFDRFSHWQELRMRYEWDLPPGIDNDAEAPIFDFSRVKAIADMSEFEKNERRRRLNVIHSRRKRERERVQVEALEEQVAALKAEHAKGKREERRLEDLLNQCHALLARLKRS